MSDERGDKDERLNAPQVPPPPPPAQVYEPPFLEETVVPPEPPQPEPVPAPSEPTTEFDESLFEQQPDPEPDENFSPVQVPAPASWPLASPRAIDPPPPPPELPPLRERPMPELGSIQPQPKYRKKRSWPKRIAVWAVKGVLIFIVGSVLLVTAYRFIPPPFTLTMAGDLIGGHSITKDWMPISEIAPSMPRAAIAAEDSGFCSHNGFDFKAMEAAYARNATGKKHIRGGSTISQQTAKNVFLWQGGGYFRKGLEAYFTVLIEAIWGKKRIMEVYLNVAETGIGTYGVNAGAQRYFGHDASRLSTQEAAQIAAVFPLPKKRAGIDPQGFTRRYGNSIAARTGVVRGDGLDSCLN